MCPHVGEGEVGAVDPVHGVPGPVQTMELPSPAYQVIFFGRARAVMVRPPAVAAAVCICHQPDWTHHHTGTCTIWLAVSGGLAAMAGRGMDSRSMALSVSTASAAGGLGSHTTPQLVLLPVTGSRQVLIHSLGGRNPPPSLP